MRRSNPVGIPRHKLSPGLQQKIDQQRIATRAKRVERAQLQDEHSTPGYVALLEQLEREHAAFDERRLARLR